MVPSVFSKNYVGTVVSLIMLSGESISPPPWDSLTTENVHCHEGTINNFLSDILALVLSVSSCRKETSSFPSYLKLEFLTNDSKFNMIPIKTPRVLFSKT